jgi:hypothetical protein
VPKLTPHNLAALASRVRLEVDHASAPPATVEEVRERRRSRLAAQSPRRAVLYVFGPTSGFHDLEYAQHYSVGLADDETIAIGTTPEVSTIERVLTRDLAKFPAGQGFDLVVAFIGGSSTKAADLKPDADLRECFDRARRVAMEVGLKKLWYL